MNSSDMFFAQFSKNIFDVVGEVMLDNETICLHYVKGNNDIVGKALTLEEALSFSNNKSTIDTGNLKNIKISALKRLYSENTARKSYPFAASAKRNVVKRYVLTFYTVKSENKLYFTVNEAENSKRQISFMSRKNAVNFDIDDIIYIGYGNHCVKIFTTDKCCNMFNISFNDAADMVLEYPNFTRSYKNCIINMDKVVRMENDSFIMTNNDVIAIPKRRLKEIKNIYKEYLNSKN